MEKLIIIRDGAVVEEIALEKQKTTIGRDGSSDVCLSDPSVSRHHGQLVRIFNDYYVEDLDSTNGTTFNNRKVKKHIVQHGDELGVGAFLLRFVDTDFDDQEVEDDLDKTVIIEPLKGKGTSGSEDQKLPGIAPKTARVNFIKGPNEGCSESIARSLYTIGKPGSDIAAIARRSQGFYLLHIGGDNYPRINNRDVDSTAGVKLSEGDVIQVGDDMAEITFG